MEKLGLELNCQRFLELLKNLIGESETLQNNPPRFIPTEDKYVNILHLMCIGLELDGLALFWQCILS